jgi:DNA-binding NarL/FixJ family response regulator
MTKTAEVDKILTDRQKDVLQLIALGVGTKDIANLLNISESAVAKHRDAIQDRLDTLNAAHSVYRATSLGILPLMGNFE